mmetsp:Transcript_5221/g.7705  ORF Transcript_5221/g.7705 Transcript_5221/m.7705 type:complete len:95 (+) Transcript_5221:2575-2859(+)
MTVKPLVGDYVRVVNGKYVGKSGRVRQLTLWKAEVELMDGHVVLIYQSSVEKCLQPVGGGRVGGGENRQRMLRQLVEAEILRVKQSMETLEGLI